MSGVPNHIPAILSGSYPIRAGNLVRPLIDGEAAFTRICEAVEAARHSVWVTVAFIRPDFILPDGRGSFFDVMDRARARGVDVRVIFWRTDRAVGEHFFGRETDRTWLGERRSSFLIRWDRAHKTYCQHQKSWLIDAGQPGEIAFVGGINLNPDSLTAPGHGHRDGDHTHDVYCEIHGPAATDVHHNFVQRWNEASERGREDGIWPEGSGETNLSFPARVSAQAGNSVVQMQRTIRAGHYSDGTPAPGGERRAIADGEHAIFDQYIAAIDAARGAIYIEDQYIAAPDVVMALRRALERGVDVTFLCPANPETQIKESKKNVMARPFYDLIGSLGQFDNFLLAGIASRRTGEAIYVHDKIMLVDDCWGTIGSCNIASQSFFCESELNAAIWDAEFVRALRASLLNEHLETETAALNAREAMALYREMARLNAARREKGEAMTGLAFALDPVKYAD